MLRDGNFNFDEKVLHETFHLACRRNKVKVVKCFMAVKGYNKNTLIGTMLGHNDVAQILCDGNQADN